MPSFPSIGLELFKSPHGTTLPALARCVELGEHKVNLLASEDLSLCPPVSALSITLDEPMELVMNLLQEPCPVHRWSTKALRSVCQGCFEQKSIIFARLQRLENVGIVLLPPLQNINHGEGSSRLAGEDSIFRCITNSWQALDQAIGQGGVCPESDDREQGYQADVPLLRPEPQVPGKTSNEWSPHSIGAATHGPLRLAAASPKRVQPFDVKRGHKAQVSIHYRRLFEGQKLLCPFQCLLKMVLWLQVEGEQRG